MANVPSAAVGVHAIGSCNGPGSTAQTVAPARPCAGGVLVTTSPRRCVGTALRARARPARAFPEGSPIPTAPGRAAYCDCLDRHSTSPMIITTNAITAQRKRFDISVHVKANAATPSTPNPLQGPRRVRRAPSAKKFATARCARCLNRYGVQRRPVHRSKIRSTPWALCANHLLSGATTNASAESGS